MSDNLLDMSLEHLEMKSWKPPRDESKESKFVNEVPEADDYVMVVAGIFDIGVQHDARYNKVQDKVCVIFELDARDSTGKPFQLHTAMTKSQYEKAPLYKLECAAFPGDSHAGLKLGDLIGKSVYGSVKTYTTKAGKHRAKVDVEAGFRKLPRGMSPIAVEGDYSQPTKLVEWFRAQAISASEADEVAKSFSAPVKGADDVTPEDVAGATGGAVVETTGTDDEIPF